MKQIAVLLVIILANFALFECRKSDPANKPDWAKKDIRDFNDADMERLLEQWEEDDDPLEEDELPEHLRPAVPIDMSKLNTQNPEEILKVSKKGKTLMAFINVSGKPTKEEADKITKLWQTGLWNNHVQAERYMVDDNRALFLFRDGSQAWEAKDFFIEQERCESVTVENKVYKGKYATGGDGDAEDAKDEL